MPNIATEEITELDAFFTDMIKGAIEIKTKDARFKATCEQIEKHGQAAKARLREILGRPE
jgi:hypothetical protein